jgi:hypothetical protein
MILAQKSHTPALLIQESRQEASSESASEKQTDYTRHLKNTKFDKTWISQAFQARKTPSPTFHPTFLFLMLSKGRGECKSFNTVRSYEFGVESAVGNRQGVEQDRRTTASLGRETKTRGVSTNYKEAVNRGLINVWRL